MPRKILQINTRPEVTQIPKLFARNRKNVDAEWLKLPEFEPRGVDQVQPRRVVSEQPTLKVGYFERLELAKRVNDSTGSS